MAGIARIGLPIVYERGSGFSPCAGQIVKLLEAPERVDLVVFLNGEEAMAEGWDDGQIPVFGLCANVKDVKHVSEFAGAAYPRWEEVQ